MPPIYTPDDFDLRSILLKLRHGALRASSEYRRHITRHDPLMFALVYFIDTLRSDDTKGMLSLCEMHIDLAQSAIEWERRFEPHESRHLWIGPREVGKSTWVFKINPIWAFAHGHRKFGAFFSDSGAQAEQHLNNIRLEFERNTWLRRDYPELCSPSNRRGNRVAGDSAKEYVSQSGVTIVAKGINAKTLGLNVDSTRPDLIVLDDIEPKGSDYNIALKRRRLNDITDAIFPMNLNAAVVIAGTTTMYGSLIHDAVRSVAEEKPVDWIVEQNIQVHYYPAIMRDDDGEERSLWPQRWSMEYLNSQRKTRTFALNMMNLPQSNEGGYWDRDDFKYKPHWKPARMILVLDPATTSRATSDYTGIAVISVPASEMEVCVEYAIGVRLKPDKLRALIHDMLMRNSLIDLVYVETNQGGDYILNNLKPLPRRIRTETVHESDPKIARVGQFLDYDTRGWVTYRKPMPALHDQQVGFPDVPNDDIVDAAAKGAHYFLRRRALV